MDKGIQRDSGAVLLQKGEIIDELSARRIAILIGECYLSQFQFGRGNPKALLYVPTLEKDAFDLALEYRLICDPLEGEKAVKPENRRQVLTVWGVNRTSGAEGSATNLKEWVEVALIGIYRIKDREARDQSGGKAKPGRSISLGERCL